jgi:hypothetical protein
MKKKQSYTTAEIRGCGCTVATFKRQKIEGRKANFLAFLGDFKSTYQPLILFKIRVKKLGGETITRTLHAYLHHRAR